MHFLSSKLFLTFLCLFSFGFLANAESSLPTANSFHQLGFEKFPLEDKSVVLEHEHSANQNPGPDYRLPGSLIPRHYILQIRPIIDKDYPGIGVKDTAPGVISVIVSCVEATNRIVMHEKFLTINESSIEVRESASDTTIPVTSVEYDEPRDFLILNLGAELRESEDYIITIQYLANVPPNDSLRGLYSETYLDPTTNQTKVMAVTQLEPLRARQVFPSLDEPTYKASFDVIIGRTENFTSLGNGPLMSSEPDTENPGWFWDKFNVTVPMPTYLFAMGVSEYDYSEANNELYRLPVRVHGPRHLVAEGRAELTANASAMLLQYFETRYGIPHNMPKVDSISVPYKRGAMENYGLITYGEYYLMYYAETTLTTELRNTYNILAHELGHQWFGNLVTCKWWSDIWLNEGFATYVSYEGMHALWPEFDMMNYMIHDSVNNALLYDATTSSHPIHQEAYDAQQIGVNMDTIGYDKGASIVRLMVYFLGEDIFYRGIKKYHTRLYDGVAEQDDLFEDLQAALDEDGILFPKTVAEIMNTWTLQKGFPLVRVKLAGQGNIEFSQEAWQNADQRNGTAPTTTWNIPMDFLGQYVSASFWLLEGEGAVNVTVENDSGWLIVNQDAGGYYRTAYDAELTTRLLQQLQSNPSTFPSAARVRLIDDQLNLGFQKYVPIEESLEFTKYLASELDLTVWSSVLYNLQKIRWLFQPDLTGSFGALRLYLIPRLESAVEKVISIEDGQVSATTLAELLGPLLVDWNCAMKSPWCDDYASQLYTRLGETGDITVIPNDLQTTMLCEIVERSDLWGASLVYLLYNQTTNRVHKSRIGPALGCSLDEDYLAALINQVFDPEYRFDKADSIPIFQQIFSNVRGRDVILNQMTNNMQTFLDYYDGNVNSLVQVFSPAALYFGTADKLEPFEGFVNANAAVFNGSLDSTLNAIRANVEWMNEYQDRLTTWFSANS